MHSVKKQFDVIFLLNNNLTPIYFWINLLLIKINSIFKRPIHTI
jgi:hypothetical protein